MRIIKYLLCYQQDEPKEVSYEKLDNKYSNQRINELMEKNDNLEIINQDFEMKLHIKEDENK